MSKRSLILVCALSGAVIGMVTYGFAAPPPGSDPNSDMARWLQSLCQPGTGTSCAAR